MNSSGNCATGVPSLRSHISVRAGGGPPCAAAMVTKAPLSMGIRRRAAKTDGKRDIGDDPAHGSDARNYSVHPRLTTADLLQCGAGAPTFGALAKYAMISPGRRSKRL